MGALTHHRSMLHLNLHTMLAGLGIGGSTGAAIVGASLVINSGITIPLETACAVCVFICGLVWWMGRKFQNLEDGQEEFRKHLTEMMKRIDDLPCDESCPRKKNH